MWFDPKCSCKLIVTISSASKNSSSPALLRMTRKRPLGDQYMPETFLRSMDLSSLTVAGVVESLEPATGALEGPTGAS